MHVCKSIKILFKIVKKEIYPRLFIMNHKVDTVDTKGSVL